MLMAKSQEKLWLFPLSTQFNIQLKALYFHITVSLVLAIQYKTWIKTFVKHSPHNHLMTVTHISHMLHLLDMKEWMWKETRTHPGRTYTRLLSSCCIKMSLTGWCAQFDAWTSTHADYGRGNWSIQTSSYRMTHFRTLKQEHEQNPKKKLA